IAFASYTVPFTIPKFGKGEWWNQLFKLSFMAPIFTFFLYIIVLFGGFLTGIQNNVASVDGGWLDLLMESIIPFVLIYIMLRKAKSLAEEYSGEIGQALTKTGNVMGGLAVGAITGGTAMLARGSVGALGSRLASSESLRNVAAKGGVRGYLARKQMNLGKYVATSSFDLRNAKVAGVGMQDIGFQELGQAKTGGYIAMRDEQIKRRQQRAADLASSPDSAPYRALQNAELEQQSLMRQQITDSNGELKSVADILAKVDKDLSDKEKEIENINNDLKNRKNDDPEKGQLEAKLKQARLDRNDLRSEKKAVKDSSVFVNSKGEVKDYSSLTKSGKVNKKAVEEIDKQMVEAEQVLQRAQDERTAMNNQVTAATVALDQAVDGLTNAEREVEEAQKEYTTGVTDLRIPLNDPQAKAKIDKAKNAVILAQKAVTDAQKNKDEVESKNTGTRVLEATTRLDQITKAQQVIAEKARTQGTTVEEESINHYEKTIIPTLKNKIETTDKERAWNYAESFGNKSKVGNAMSWLWKRGDYSADAERQAAYRIKMGAKIDQ
ncbi:MAG: hypothetical protein ACKOW9_06350, partial [Candidatus Paceibacterota bacterium]